MNPTDFNTGVNTGGVIPPSMIPSEPMETRPLSHGTPATPLFGVLPIARLIPQDIHSCLDYANGAQALASAIFAEDPICRSVGILKAMMVIGISAATDYRLSFAKIVPIEVHEVADYVWGFGIVAAPFLFGYWKKSKVASMIQVTAGLMALGVSLVTDYRAARGVKWPKVNAALV